MNDKNLRHYHRKKMFYRFFMRKSPRTGTMFGLAWICMTVSLFPFALFAVFCWFWKFSSLGMVYAAAGTTFLLAFPVYLYGAVLCVLGLTAICLPVVYTGFLALAGTTPVSGLHCEC